VVFYSYSGGVVNSTPLATGVLPTLDYNKTVRAEIQWSPGTTGNFVLYANISAQNEYAGDYINGPQTVTQSITVNPNPTTTLLTDLAIAAVVIIVIAAIVYLLFRRSKSKSAPSKTSGSRSAKDQKAKDKDEDDEDEDDDK
jgi:ATP-dependent Zn protease